MALKHQPGIEVGEELLEAIRVLPLRRKVEHCGVRLVVDPFAFCATCTQCGDRIKLRAFSAAGEIEDIFDAVLEWMNRPGARELAEGRRATLEDES